MIYKFTIKDSHNFSHDQIINEALKAAKDEWSFNGLDEDFEISLVSDNNVDGSKEYYFVAQTMEGSQQEDGESSSNATRFIVRSSEYAASSVVQSQI